MKKVLVVVLLVLVSFGMVASANAGDLIIHEVNARTGKVALKKTVLGNSPETYQSLSREELDLKIFSKFIENQVFKLPPQRDYRYRGYKILIAHNARGYEMLATINVVVGRGEHTRVVNSFVASAFESADEWAYRLDPKTKKVAWSFYNCPAGGSLTCWGNPDEGITDIKLPWGGKPPGTCRVYASMDLGKEYLYSGCFKGYDEARDFAKRFINSALGSRGSDEFN